MSEQDQDKPGYWDETRQIVLPDGRSITLERAMCGHFANMQGGDYTECMCGMPFCSDDCREAHEREVHSWH